MTSKKKVVKNEEQQSCGCYVTTYSDDTILTSPCPPCGLLAVAQFLGKAAEALSATARRIRAETNHAAVAQAAKDVAGG